MQQTLLPVPDTDPLSAFFESITGWDESGVNQFFLYNPKLKINTEKYKIGDIPMSAYIDYQNGTISFYEEDKEKPEQYREDEKRPLYTPTKETEILKIGIHIKI